MRILDRYLMSEYVKTSAAVLLVLLVLMVGNTLVKLLSSAAEGEMAGSYVWPLLVITLANYFVLFMGLSLYLGGMVTFGRLYKDTEVSALVACGAGPWVFFRPVLKVAVPLTALAFILSLYVAPKLAQLQAEFLFAAESPSIETVLREGEFNQVSNGVIFVESDEDSELQNIFMYRKDERGNESLQLAQRGRIQDIPRAYAVDLYDGVIYQYAVSGNTNRIDYQEYHSEIPKPGLPAIEPELPAIPTIDLLKSDNPFHIAEWQWRFSLPIGCLLLSLLAFPLSYTTPRKGVFGRIGYAIVIYIIYSNVLGVAKSMVQSQKIPHELGMWWAHVPVLCLIAFLCWQQYGHRRVNSQASA